MDDKEMACRTWLRITPQKPKFLVNHDQSICICIIFWEEILDRIYLISIRETKLLAISKLQFE